MIYSKTSNKPVADAAADLEQAVKDGGFGVLHTYDLKATLHNKGIDLPQECRILEVCNPHQAARVLNADMGLNVALPCRISVYEDEGITQIGMIRPTALLAGLSQDDTLAATAESVESALIGMIDSAV